MIPPEADAEFVAHMEDVLETYEKPYDPTQPVLCMDEQPVQLVKETRQPIPATKDHPKRVDYEYERNGHGQRSSCLPNRWLAGGRLRFGNKAPKSTGRTEMAALLEGRYADCEKVIARLRQPQHAHQGAFYEAFEPERARQYVRRIDFCFTPKHGSWLNIAENELSSMTRQCVHGRRIGELGTLQQRNRLGPTTSTKPNEASIGK